MNWKEIKYRLCMVTMFILSLVLIEYHGEDSLVEIAGDIVGLTIIFCVGAYHALRD